MKARASLLALCCALALAPHAFADDPVATPPTDAQQKFDEGRAALGRGDFKEGLELFRASQALAPGRGTLVNMALCEEGLGLLATALQHFLDVLPQLPPSDDRVPVVTDHIKSLKTRVPYLRVMPPPGLAAPTLSVRLDDAPLDPARIGVEVPLDPGKHVVLASAPGHPDRRYEVALFEGTHVTVAIELDAPASAAPPAVVSPPPSSGRRTAGFAIGAVGLAALAAGGVTGAIAIADHGSTDGACPLHVHCSSDVLATASTGKALSVVSTIAFAAGAAGVGIGAYLILSSGSSSPGPVVGVALAPGGARASFGRVF